MQALSDELSCYAKKDEISSFSPISAISQLSNDVGYLSAETDPVFRSLSSSFLTAESGFASLSSTFLTAHQSLSGVMPFEAASGQMQTLARDLGVSYTSWTDSFQPNDNGSLGGLPVWFYPRAFGMPNGAYIRAITIHTTST